ncbi:MAG TPA: thioredoxin domain-containing protein, partial [Candidatus Limnocylindrales bacterium]|nr:thioredoxin domain-containing protein [Candidatus Limnocylindrales bacterium]
CHVMERESFEDDATAGQLNASFVSVKVDREERPDLDAIYMDAVQAMTGQGGWPMTVFLTPDGKPFYGGTYFPNQSRYGMPSFRDVLSGVERVWRDQRAEAEAAGERLRRTIDASARADGHEHVHQPEQAASGATAPKLVPAPEPAAWMFDAAMVGFESGFDATNGGWGRAPKFPQPMSIEALLREHVRSGDARSLAMARRSLDAMADGGIYDHLGGGFARYATDAIWLVPHFEKMLYDNAQLARVYLHAWQLTGGRRYREVAVETLDYVAREMRTPEGAFTASQDADTDGDEGLTYVWDAAEVREVLGDEAELFMRAYGVRDGGNWEGRTILSRVRDDESLARDEGASGEDVRERLARARRLLFERRTGRPQPGRDNKALAAWNGLMLAAFSDAARALGSPVYRQIALTAGGFMLDVLRDERGRLRRSWKDGRAVHNGVLEDYTNLAEGLLALYEATFEERWFAAARALMDVVLEHFVDPAGGFFDTSDDHERLITRPKGLQDNATPSGNAMAATVLL